MNEGRIKTLRSFKNSKMLFFSKLHFLIISYFAPERFTYLHSLHSKGHIYTKEWHCCILVEISTKNKALFYLGFFFQKSFRMKWTQKGTILPGTTLLFKYGKISQELIWIQLKCHISQKPTSHTNCEYKYGSANIIWLVQRMLYYYRGRCIKKTNSLTT